MTKRQLIELKEELEERKVILGFNTVDAYVNYKLLSQNPKSKRETERSRAYYRDMYYLEQGMDDKQSEEYHLDKALNRIAANYKTKIITPEQVEFRKNQIQSVNAAATYAIGGTAMGICFIPFVCDYLSSGAATSTIQDTAVALSVCAGAYAVSLLGMGVSSLAEHLDKRKLTNLVDLSDELERLMQNPEISLEDKINISKLKTRIDYLYAQSDMKMYYREEPKRRK